MATDLPPLADTHDLHAVLPALDLGKAVACLEAASSRFRGAVRHPVSLVEDDVVWLDGDGSRALLLPAAPVLEVSSVQVDGAEVEVEWSDAGVLSRRSGRWPDRMRAVRVVYSHGYDPVPAEVREAVVAMARYLAVAQPGVSSMQVGGQTVTTSAAAVDATVGGPWDTVVAAYRLNRGDAP